MLHVLKKSFISKFFSCVLQAIAFTMQTYELVVAVLVILAVYLCGKLGDEFEVKKKTNISKGKETVGEEEEEAEEKQVEEDKQASNKEEEAQAEMSEEEKKKTEAEEQKKKAAEAAVVKAEAAKRKKSEESKQSAEESGAQAVAELESTVGENHEILFLKDIIEMKETDIIDSRKALEGAQDDRQKTQCKLNDKDEAMRGLEQKYEQELKTIRNFNRDLADKNTAFAEENKS